MSKMKQALSASIQAEDRAFKSRFERAESLLQPGQEIPQQLEPSQPAQPLAIRDTFSFPEADYALIAQLQERCLQSATVANKSELVRAGLHALTQLTDAELISLMRGLVHLKPGRTAKPKRK